MLETISDEMSVSKLVKPNAQTVGLRRGRRLFVGTGTSPTVVLLLVSETLRMERGKTFNQSMEYIRRHQFSRAFGSADADRCAADSRAVKKQAADTTAFTIAYVILR
jgi:hypothetical protein